MKNIITLMCCFIFLVFAHAQELNLDTIDIMGDKKITDPKGIIENSIKKGVSNQARRYGEMIKKYKPSKKKDKKYKKALKGKFNKQMDDVLGIETDGDGEDVKQEVNEKKQVVPVYVVPGNLISEVQVPQNNNIEYPLQLTPLFGVANISAGKAKFESGPMFGLSIGSQISPKWSSIIKITHFQMKMTDTQELNYDNLVPVYISKNNPDRNPFKSRVGDTKNVDRKIKGKLSSVSVNSRYWISNPNKKFKVFVNAGLGYNRASLKYDDLVVQHENQFGRLTTFKDSGGNSFSFFTGSIGAGTQFDLDKTIHIDLAIDYTKGFSGGASESNFRSVDVATSRLDKIRADIKKAGFASIVAGLVINI